MKLKSLWWCLFKRPAQASRSVPETASVPRGDSQNRALVWLGKDKLERQYFYEQWACHETWHVYDEGIVLLFGRDPEDPSLREDREFNEQRAHFWKHLQRCVRQQASPRLDNPAESPEQWRAEPVELYRWAVAARLEVPQELDDLLSFISQTVKPSVLQGEPEQTADTGDQGIAQSMAREQVLTAMLSLSLQAQHQVSGADADAMREQILQTLYAKSQRYFDRPEPPLSRPALHDLVDRSLEMAGLVR